MPKTHNLYWLCLRCGNRWKNQSNVFYKDRGWEPVIDRFSGDAIFIPPKESCSRCGSKYNVRFFLDAGVGTINRSDDVGSYDPWTCQEITI
jgi:hypothetical protein